MTLRDLTKRELVKLQIRCNEELIKRKVKPTPENQLIWSDGFRAGLEFAPSRPLGGQPKP